MTYISFSDEKRPNVYLSIEMTSGFLRVRHSGSTIYSKQRLAIDVNHTISVIIGHMVNIPDSCSPWFYFSIQNLFKVKIDQEEVIPKETNTMPGELQKIINETFIGGVPAEIADYAKGKGDIQSTNR